MTWTATERLPSLLATIALAFVLAGQAGAAARPALEVTAMKTLPLGDLPRAVDYARQFRDVGVTHLVHTQEYENVAEYRRTIALLEEQIRLALD